MESSSTQAFDSDDSARCFPMDSYDGHDFEDDDDDLSKNIDLCLGEVDRIIEQSNENLHSMDSIVEPYIGMEFVLRDDAREYYIAYGRQTGFTVRIHHNRRSRVNNTVIGQDFVCSKEGFREKKYICRKDRVLPPPPITREGCPAMLRLALRDGHKWVVTKCVKEHNHTLMSPSKVPWRGSAKNLVTEDEKDKRIFELTIELNNERQRCKRKCGAYQEQLHMLLAYIEEHTNHLSSKVENVVNNLKELENEQLED